MGSRGATCIYNSELIISLEMEPLDSWTHHHCSRFGVLNSPVILTFESIMTLEFSQQRNMKWKGRAKFCSVPFKTSLEITTQSQGASTLVGLFFPGSDNHPAAPWEAQEDPGCNLKTSYYLMKIEKLNNSILPMSWHCSAPSSQSWKLRTQFYLSLELFQLVVLSLFG